jgi:tRNA (mo5U34)-methyltransferase
VSASASGATRSFEDVPLWYHTIELPGGPVTPGWFDLRGIVNKLPWPDVRGKRCLDVGTYDGFFAFEMERRGAREVIATDIARHADWDLLPAARASAPQHLEMLAGQKGLGFEVARQALGSRVEKHIVSVYELSPEELGTFDVVVCGSLMLHLRDPVRALESIRSVCHAWFMSIEEVSLSLSTLFPRRPIAEMRMSAQLGQWWVANTAGHAQMVEVAGFEVSERVGPFSEPFGVSHAPRGSGPRELATRLLKRLLTGGDGVPHAAVVARPAAGPSR